MGQRFSFDAARYWAQRLAATPGLVGTGTSGLPDAWQRWLYRSKREVHLGLLARNQVRLADRRVLDFGCGTGYFEDVWHHAGARELMGIDLVPQLIAQLAIDHPDRQYLAVDLAREPRALDALPTYDLVTAIDVVYHVVEDRQLAIVLGALLDRVAPGGAFLFSDALRTATPAAHVRFRSLAWWRAMLATFDFSIVDREAVAIVNNRPSPLARIWPHLTGATQYYADVVARGLAPRLPITWINNWSILARRTASTSR
jgi:SAM-dependent methyltransferase